MQISGFAWMLVLATAALSSQSASAATNTTKTPAYYCKTDDDCASWPNTVCITVEAKDPISKCTPNTVARPACRAGQFGLCPSYQDTSRGYLNAHCIFVADDSVAPATVTATTTTTTAPAATTAARQLQTTTSPAATVKAAGSSSGSSTTTSATRAPLTVAPAEDTTTTTESSGSSDSTTTSGTSVGDSTSSGSDTMAAAVKSASYKIGNQTVYGIFKCADLSECDNLAADPTTCRPAKCGDSTSVEQCTNQGTCTHTSKQDIKMRSCMCYKGFSGTKCEKTESGECDVDCGQGGDCVDGECVCHAGFDGKKYKNKQGKADSRCTKCTSDLACENSNTCDIETGKCDCGAGYTGATCGGVEDDCVTLDCGVGMCQVVDTTATCMCPICDPECQKCPTKNCSTCPSAASSVTISIGAILVAVVASLMMG